MRCDVCETSTTTTTNAWNSSRVQSSMPSVGKVRAIKKGVSFCSILISNYLLRLLKRKKEQKDVAPSFLENFMIFIAFLQVICCGWQSHMMIECVLVVGFSLSALSLKSETEIFWSIDVDKEFVACNNATACLHWTLTENKQRMRENES